MIPRPSRPEYSTTVPSTGQKVRYQPFTIREEKALILAAEGKDPDEITNAIRICLQNCITSPQDINIDALALFDIEYLFLKTRAKSVGEKVELIVTDPSDPSYSVEHAINIDKIGVEKNKQHTDLIEIDDVKIKMKYPNLSFFAEGINVGNYEDSFNVLTRCISQIIVGDEVYNKSDMTKDELVEWLEGLSTKHYAELIKFFTTMPKLKHSFTLKNKNTGKDFTISLEGLSDFF